MNAPLKRKTRMARCGLHSNDSDGQGPIELDCNPLEFRALALACLMALNIARTLMNQLATLTSMPPFVIVEAANLIEHACDLLANYLATGGPQ
jgi:hypothetical protein